MKTEYYGYSKKGGVYRITNLNNRKIYVGSAKEFKSRYKGHLSSLRNNKHQNKHLQASFAKYGEDVFLFEVIEVVEGDKGERFEVEQKHINQLIKEGKWENTFNFEKKAVRKERTFFSKTPEKTRKKMSKAKKGKNISLETRKKISEARKGMKFSKEHKEKLAAKKKGRKFSKETRDKMSKSHKSEYALKRLKETYEKYGEHIRARQRKAVSKRHLLLKPDNTFIVVENLNIFCRERGMNSAGFSNLLRKKNKDATYKGWKYFGSF